MDSNPARNGLTKLHLLSRRRLKWWRHEMQTFHALPAICAGNSQGTIEFPAKGQWRGVLRVFFDLRLNKRLSKQSWGLWF